MKQNLTKLLRDEDHDIIDLGNGVHNANYDYPELAISIAGAVLCATRLSLRRGVEDHDVNVLYFGCRTIGVVIAWDRMLEFLGTKLRGEDRHPRSLAK